MGKLIVKNDNGQEFVLKNDINDSAKELSPSDFKYIRDTIKDIPSIPTLADGDVLFVKGYHEVGDQGGGVFVWNSNEPKANHNGGTVIDPSKQFPSDWTLEDLKDSWFNTTNEGTGCWKRVFEGVANVSWFGAVGDGEADDTKAIQKVIDVSANKNNIIFDMKKYLCGNIKIYHKTYIDFNNALLLCKKDERLIYNLEDEIEISLENLIIDMQGDQFTPTTTTYNGLYAIYIRYPNHSIFKNIKITDSPMIAFCIGIPGTDGAVDPYDSRSVIDNLIIENTGLSFVDDLSDNKGLKIVSQKNITITNSRFYGCRGQGLHTVNCENILISKCTTKNNTNGGIWLSYGTTGSTIDNCISEDDDNVAYGLNPGHYMRDIANGKPNRLSNSYCYTNGHAIAAIFGDFIIENNELYSAGSCISSQLLSADQNKNVPQLAIYRNNSLYSIDPNKYSYGIYIDDTILTTHISNYKNIYIENNKLYDWQNRGIKINTYNDVVTENVNIIGNKILNSHQNCISISNANDITIKNNYGNPATTDKVFIATLNCSIILSENNKLLVGSNFYSDNGGNSITLVNEIFSPFYQKGVFSATGDGSATTLTFNFTNMKVIPKIASIYQVDDDINGWRVSAVASDHVDIEFATAPANGKVKQFFIELKLSSYTS